MGGDCSQKLLLRRGLHPLRGAADLRINTSSITLSQRSAARGLVSHAASFSRMRVGGCDLPPSLLPASHHRFVLNQFSPAGLEPPLLNIDGVVPTAPAKMAPASAAANRFHCNRTRPLPAQPLITLPDVRTDDEVRQLAAARRPAQGAAVAPSGSPACPFPATGASWSRDNTP
jgi:hypothetical protein